MAKPVRDLVGKRIGRLTVIELATKDKDGRARWLCKCDCGNYKIIRNSALGTNVVSCGCKKRETLESNAIQATHGKSRTRLYGVWGSMVDRCENPNAHEYENYGGRGIKVCDEWRNDYTKFEEWALANGYNEKATRKESTLDRIDVNGNYEPSNCRFATMKTQSRNRRSNVFATIDGETHCLAEWAEIVGINYSTLLQRIYAGWSIENALKKPVGC